MKKLFLAAILIAGTTFTLNTFAQDKKDEDVIERPSACGTSSIDAYSTKAFDTYDESKKITHDIYFIKVEIKEVPANKDGVTTEMKITDGDGKALTKEGALEQFGKLLVRSMKQDENIKTLIALQKPASEDLKSVPMMKKAKASKELSASGDAQAFVVSETKKQTDLLNQQISTLKALKNN